MNQAPPPIPWFVGDLLERIDVLQRKVYAVETELHTVETENAALRRLLVAEPPRQWLTCEEVALLVNRDAATIRIWCRRHRIGAFDQRRKFYKIDREHLKRYYSDRFGAAALPVALQD